MNTKRSPNDQRSDVKNPNNREFKDAQDNRANQLNPNRKPAPAAGGTHRHGQKPKADEER